MGYIKLISLLFFCIGVDNINANQTKPNAISELYDQLLTKADPLIPPFFVTNDKVEVAVGLSLLGVGRQGRNTIRLSTWFTQSWIDPRLQWDPTRYAEAAEVILPASKVWKPDLSVFNAVEANEVFPVVPTALNLIIRSSGDVFYMVPHTFTVPIKHVENNLTFVLKLGSWSTNGNQIDLKNNEIDLTPYITNECLALNDLKMIRKEIKYTCCPEPYIDLVLTGEMQVREECQ